MKKTLYIVVTEGGDMKEGDIFSPRPGAGNAPIWLRPVTVTLPQEVSDEAIGKYAVLLTQYVEGQPDFMDVKNNCTNAMTHMRDLLLPYLATLQQEIKNLDAEVERQKQKVQNERLDYISLNTAKQQEAGLAETEIRRLKTLLESCEKALEERDARLLWYVECFQCGCVYENRAGSTPCCGSICYIIEKPTEEQIKNCVKRPKP